jgi:hypothetical protein
MYLRYTTRLLKAALMKLLLVNKVTYVDLKYYNQVRVSSYFEVRITAMLEY